MGFIIAAALSIGSSIVGAIGQSKADKANKKAAEQSLKFQNKDISIRAIQERLATSQESDQLTKQAANASGLTSASAAAGNVGGATVDMLLQDVENTRLLSQDRINQQSSFTQSALMRERSGALASSRNQANQTSAPNPFAVAMRIGSDLMTLEAQRRVTTPKVNP